MSVETLKRDAARIVVAMRVLMKRTGLNEMPLPKSGDPEDEAFAQIAAALEAINDSMETRH